MPELVYLLLFFTGAVAGYAARGRLDWRPEPMPPEVCLRDLADRKDLVDEDEGRLDEIVAELTGSHAKLVDLRGYVSYRHADYRSGRIGRDTEHRPLTPVEHVLKVADEELSHAINRLAVSPVRLPSPRSQW